MKKTPPNNGMRFYGDYYKQLHPDVFEAETARWKREAEERAAAAASPLGSPSPPLGSPSPPLDVAAMMDAAAAAAAGCAAAVAHRRCRRRGIAAAAACAAACGARLLAHPIENADKPRQSVREAVYLPPH